MKLSTRLSLSYIGFLALLAVLILILAGLQIRALARQLQEMPAPASRADARYLAGYLADAGLEAPLPEKRLQDTLQAGGWVQVLDAQGREVRAINGPPDRRTRYLPAELGDLNGEPTRWAYQTAVIRRDDQVLGLLIMAVPPDQLTVPLSFGPRLGRALGSHILKGMGKALLGAILLSLLVGFLYARRLARPLVRLSSELKAAAEGDFTRRVPAAGSDEFSTLARAFNHLMERLSAAEAERSRLEKARRDLVANLSHDLRTPLTSIQGFAESLADASTPPESRRRYATVIRARVEELDALLSDLLELSRLQALPEVQREPVDLAELVRQRLIDLLPEMEQAGLHLEVEIPDRLPPVPADPRLMERALTNLIVNAMRHSRGATNIAVTLAEAGPEVALTVADDGPGIPKNEVPMLFERYYRGTSSTARGRSTGLGLAIVRQIAENHGGRVSVQTAEGKGAAFTIWLPRWQH